MFLLGMFRLRFTLFTAVFLFLSAFLLVCRLVFLFSSIPSSFFSFFWYVAEPFYELFIFSLFSPSSLFRRLPRSCTSHHQFFWFRIFSAAASSMGGCFVVASLLLVPLGVAAFLTQLLAPGVSYACSFFFLLASAGLRRAQSWRRPAFLLSLFGCFPMIRTKLIWLFSSLFVASCSSSVWGFLLLLSCAGGSCSGSRWSAACCPSIPILSVPYCCSVFLFRLYFDGNFFR